MSETAMAAEAPSKAPWHLWAVGVLALLWYGSGAYTIIAAQRGMLPGIEPDERAYYAAQQAWFVAVTDLGLACGIAAGVAFLLRSRWAVTLTLIMIAAIAVTAAYDLAAGTSRMYANSGALIVTVLIWVVAVLQYWYAASMRKRGVLR
jgi:hypothetical protein